jgi:type II secretory pathway component GspD/PulD (secretin)
MKKINVARKTLAVTVAVIFAFFSVCIDCMAQMDMGGTETTAAAAVKQTLPATGNVTVNFKDVDIKTVLHYLSEVSGVDIVPSPGVDASITMRLRDKPWEVALDIVTRNYGYVYSSDDEQGIIRVMPKSQLRDEEPITEVVPLNHMIREIELAKEEEGEEVVVQAKQESILQLLMAINSILDIKKGERATYISGANAIVITAIPARIAEVKNMISKIDKKTPQIILDCKVIEIRLDDDERFGIDWNAVISAAGATRPTTFPFTGSGIIPWLPGGQRKFYPGTGFADADATNQQSSFPMMDMSVQDPLGLVYGTNNLFTYGTLDFTQFTATLSLIEDRTDTEVLSAPRITTLNNQKATIKVVEKIMLQKTQETTQTAGIVTVEFEKEAEAREVGVILTVIPHVNEEGDISVNLLPEVSTRLGATGFETVQVGANLNAIALTFTSREANTIVRVKDGETIFLGGLIRENTTVEENKIPLLGDLLGGIPIIGNTVKYEAENIEKTEVVFFITVHLVKDGMDTVRASKTEAYYNKFIVKNESVGPDGDRPKGDGTILQKGEVEESTKVVEVHLDPVAEEPKKEYKPFLDFRKKAEGLSNKQ